MDFFKGRKPKPKEFPAPQKQLLRKMYPGVSTADVAVTQAHQSPFQAGSTTWQCHTLILKE